MAKRVLIVEDDREASLMVAWALELAGYEPQRAISTQAADIARDWQPACVLLDMIMPVVDGWEVARRLRAEKATADIPLIVMTSLHTEDRAAEVGTPHYLAKPFDVDLLLVRVAEVIGPANPADPTLPEAAA